MSTSTREFLESQPRVLVTAHGDGLAARVELDGVPCPACGVSWRMSAENFMPIVRLDLLARLSVNGGPELKSADGAPLVELEADGVRVNGREFPITGFEIVEFAPARVALSFYARLEVRGYEEAPRA